MASQSALSSNVSAAAAFEDTLWANGPADSDPFYVPPPESINAPPGALLKLESNTTASNYSIASGIAISRIMYQSQTFDGTFNGTSVPASAYVLWPYQPRVRSDGSLPIVAWAHGTSGIYGNCAPSNLKALWDHFRAPYPLALQGYVVVAPDYAGLGVAKTADGKDIVHQYVANPAHANDLFYSVEAAQSAFRELSSEFVIMGHSQGGGAAWGAAQRQALKPVKGYLGAIAIAPVTDVLEIPDTGNPLIPILGALLTPGIKSLFQEFDPLSIFTELGWERFQAYGQARGCNSVALELLAGFQLLKNDWMQNEFVQKYIRLTLNGGRDIGGPLLVIQGEADPNMDIITTTSAVNKLVQAFPNASVRYLTLPGIAHISSLYVSQRVWLDWIESRFAGVPVESGYQKSEASNIPRSISSYASDGDWYISTATKPFQLMVSG